MSTFASEAPAEPSADELAEHGWRHLLLERLLWVTLPLATAGYLATLATSGPLWKWVLSVETLPTAACWVAALARRWSLRARGSLFIGACLYFVLVTYSIAAFQDNGAIIGALAVVASGLLFGRRAMLIVLVLALAAPIITGAAMLGDVLPQPSPVVFSPARLGPWVRTTSVTIVVWTLLGVVVTSVIAHIERAAEKERAALLDLRAEEARRAQAEGERHQAERAAFQAQKLELVGSLASGVAHDFNNVLGVVQGWASLALKPGADAGMRTAAAEAIDSAARQGAALARQLLALGRRGVRTVTSCRMHDEVESSIQALRWVLPEEVELTLDQEGEAWIDADKSEIQQLVFNLVINARDAMPTGGRLSVTTGIESWSEPRTVVGGQLPPGQWAFLAVRDTGTGMSPEVQSQIFAPFFTTKANGKGTGLGLWTVLGIIKASGGGLLVETQLGVGTSFRVYFSARSVGAPTAVLRDAPILPGRGRSARILVLEDREPLSRLIREVLASWGHDVMTVARGNEALTVLRKSHAPFDLLCTDAVVPGTPAREVIEAFERAHPSAPVLIVSGYVDEELTRRGIEQGRYRLLRKPFQPEDLAATVADLLKGSAAEPGRDLPDTDPSRIRPSHD